jgi:hypothetical protein
MTASMIPVSVVIELIGLAEVTFPNAHELEIELSRSPVKDILFRSGSPISLANTLEVKYRAAMTSGVGVEGLEETLNGLRTLGEQIVKSTLVELPDRFFLLMVDDARSQVVGLMKVLSLINGQPMDNAT